MTELQQDQLQELRYRFYERQILLGAKIRLDQVHVCRFCGAPYKRNLSMGASKLHCHNQDCRDAALREARERDNAQRRALYRRKLNRELQHV